MLDDLRKLGDEHQQALSNYQFGFACIRSSGANAGEEVNLSNPNAAVQTHEIGVNLEK